MKLIIGLGNPGKEYRLSRHNIGRELVMDLASRLEEEALREWKVEFDYLILKTKVGSEKILLVLPETFMNLSGQAVAKCIAFYHIPTGNLLVVHDEMDFAPGTFAYGKAGSSAGHNGVTSLIDSLGTDAFARLRIGIGRPIPPVKSEAYVLQKMDTEERSLVDNATTMAKTSVLDWVSQGIDKTMNKWNVVKSGKFHMDI